MTVLLHDKYCPCG